MVRATRMEERSLRQRTIAVHEPVGGGEGRYSAHSPPVHLPSRKIESVPFSAPRKHHSTVEEARERPGSDPVAVESRVTSTTWRGKPIADVDHPATSSSPFVTKKRTRGDRHGRGLSSIAQSLECPADFGPSAFGKNIKQQKVGVDALIGKDSGAQAKCLLCNSTFESGTQLQSHIVQVHEKRRRHICEICSSGFNQSSHLRLHVAMVHKQERPFVCTSKDCPAKFASKSNLSRHVKMVGPS